METDASVAPAPPAPDAKWSDDAFLDRLRASTDDDANEVVARLEAEEGDLESVNRILAGIHGGGQPLPASAPAPLLDFSLRFAEIADSCGLDPAQIARGGAVFHRWAYPAAVVMLASSLPSGYSAPCLGRVLTISDDLGAHPYRRLLAVIQLLVNVSSPAADGSRGDAYSAALKLRLLHAGVRRLVPEHRPGYLERYGTPVNHEDMLATLMGFSLLVVDGIEALGFRMKAGDVEAYWALWHHFARLLAIAPAEDPTSTEFVPATLHDARAFYLAYQRRWFCEDPAENPEGVHLTARNRQMMIDLVPRPLRRLGLGRAPDIAMTELLGERGLARLGLQPLSEHARAKEMLHAVLRVGQGVEAIGEDFYSLFSAAILQSMVNRGVGTVTFSVPDSLEALKGLAEPAPPRTPRTPKTPWRRS